MTWFDPPFYAYFFGIKGPGPVKNLGESRKPLKNRNFHPKGGHLLEIRFILYPVARPDVKIIFAKKKPYYKTFLERFRMTCIPTVP